MGADRTYPLLDLKLLASTLLATCTSACSVRSISCWAIGPSDSIIRWKSRFFSGFSGFSGGCSGGCPALPSARSDISIVLHPLLRNNEAHRYPHVGPALVECSPLAQPLALRDILPTAPLEDEPELEGIPSLGSRNSSLRRGNDGNWWGGLLAGPPLLHVVATSGGHPHQDLGAGTRVQPLAAALHAAPLTLRVRAPRAAPRKALRRPRSWPLEALP